MRPPAHSTYCQKYLFKFMSYQFRKKKKKRDIDGPILSAGKFRFLLQKWNSWIHCVKEKRNCSYSTMWKLLILSPGDFKTAFLLLISSFPSRLGRETSCFRLINRLQVSIGSFLSDCFFVIQAPVQNTAVGLINGNEACIIHMLAVEDLLCIISASNQFVSLSASVYLLSCWDKGGKLISG